MTDFCISEVFITFIMMKNFKTHLWVLIFSFVSLVIQGQRLGKDTMVNHQNIRPLYFRPVIDITGVNFIINRFDTHIMKVDWSSVSLSSWKLNLDRGFLTDGDAFPTNWLGHPIHGSLFFNAARMNQMNFWQSIPYVMGGSMMWEFLGETEPASSIDFYTTSLGGIFLGEVIYRLTDYAWNYPPNNKYPIIGKISGSLLNPVAGINRFIFGKKIPFTKKSLTPVAFKFYIGTNHPLDNMISTMKGTGLILNAEVYYGELFNRNQKNFGPFDYFKINSWLNFSEYPGGNKDTYFNLSSEAIILGSKITNRPNKTELISLTQHYDFIHNDIFKIGSIVLTGDWTYQQTFDRVRVLSSTKLGVVLFGSGNSELVEPVLPDVFPEFERDYIYGQGFMAELEFIASFRKSGTIAANLNHFIIYSKSQPKGVENLDLIRAKYLYPIGNRFDLGLQFDYYHRNGNYYSSKGIIRNKSGHQELKLLFGYTL
ncbi:MAG: DUF3943 domain-containing protein [Saprospiraceae bacterium]|nr:DUF3943 domain-containing protein [Saprospiraceae bacterium]